MKVVLQLTDFQPTNESKPIDLKRFKLLELPYDIDQIMHHRTDSPSTAMCIRN